MIKNYSKYLEMKKENQEVNWHVKITSTTKRFDLTDDMIDKIFKCFDMQEYKDFKSRTNKSMLDMYGQYPIAVWQVNKSTEIENLFHNNLKYTINGDNIDVITEFDVKLPEDFEYGDVIDWLEGFNRVNKLFWHMSVELDISDLLNQHQHLDKFRSFLHTLEKNQKFDVKK